ncbi:hypothetical protein JBL43_18820 [Aureibaculum sp. A20]|uniref:Secreted protein n=1 Tax=Aureibaculum flavum TaxID=2795986 RepID=A0ABS0WWD4_9FLAO|nr:hypothetical protein [Aureibaculum flavum]MBJ2176311.1 hypothetical protein [Aureibaculum flavum]MBJ2176312.1 hypothetical protein [Aureibaculum flavum]
MKTLRNTFVLLLLSVAFYSCDADATLNELEQAEQTELSENISADTGDQGNEPDEREEEDDLVDGN